ncbi:MAG TPA: FAD-dependent oxidoreductase [Thermodesulfovibrionales bacterium]|nr:FAD-dependent oxidoreductase [Thermodesulfovibrionales bacterium]
MTNEKKEVVILGGGLTGLSAGHALTRAARKVKVFEREPEVGGLSKTVVKDGFRFDLGGHRFFTKDEKTDAFVRNLMDGELVSVARKSKIFMRNRYFDYPLRPVNAVFGLGVPTTLKIIGDYGREKIRDMIKVRDNVSLEDWVISNFGRKMFDIYFREYSEKVWGIECNRISAEWMAQRISGLSLSKAVKNAFFKFSGRDIPTLADRFLFPELGIGRISDRLKEGIETDNEVFTGTEVVYVSHSNYTINGIGVSNRQHSGFVPGREFISSIPLTKLLNLLRPAPPEDILDIASRLKFRDLVVVAIMINKKRVTDQSWIYIPERKIPFGRIHEPTNWSEKMAPHGKTLVVIEYFSFAGDNIWSKEDGELVDMSVEGLEHLGFVRKSDVIDGAVVRVPKAYPLFEVGYRGLCDKLYDYLARFRNLHLAGRAGMFRYYNMDHAIESGMDAAEKILGKMQE